MQENGKWTTNQMIAFFCNKYSRVVNLSTIYESLSNKFQHLDEEDSFLLSDFREHRRGSWPDLDAAVYDW